MKYDQITKLSAIYIFLRLIDLLGFSFLGALIAIAGGSDSHAVYIYIFAGGSPFPLGVIILILGFITLITYDRNQNYYRVALILFMLCNIATYSYILFFIQSYQPDQFSTPVNVPLNSLLAYLNIIISGVFLWAHLKKHK